MRTLLIDWMVTLHSKFRLLPETLFLSVYILDAFLCRHSAKPENLQLIGVAASFIASKYEEIYPPEVKDFIYMTDRDCKHQDVLDMELQILDVLQYRISAPTAYHFHCRYCTLLAVGLHVTTLGQYYLERTLQEYSFVGIKPSLMAAASLCLAMNQYEVYELEGVDPVLPGVVRVWACM
jgi:G2/mitotic-specific cyclin-B, other